MKKSKRLFSVLLAVCMMILMAVPVWADETDSVNAVRNGVLQVNLNWIDQSGKAHPIQGGSGFLINDQTLLTNQHVVEMDDETKAAASEAYGVDFVHDTKLEVRVQVVVQRDVLIDATVRASSVEMDVAVIELAEPIYDRTSVTLGDSSSIAEAKKIYALGFPKLPEAVQDIRYYTNDDVTLTDGIVSKKIKNNGTPFIQHSAKISSGNSGGPLVNEDGQVVGINTFGIIAEEGYYYAMEINDVKNLLNALGITYNDEPTPGPVDPGDDPVDPGDDPVTPPEETTVLNTDALEATIEDAKAKELDGNYTEESLRLLTNKLDKARDVAKDKETSQELVDKATEDLEDAIGNLEEKKGISPTVIGIIVAIVVAVIILIVVLVITSSKKKTKQEEEIRRRMREEQEIERRRNEMKQSTIPNGSVPSGGDGSNTTLLGRDDNGSSGTTVLGVSAQNAAYMIRKKNNERVGINGANFTIGKERSRVNYCISDNTSVSRCHARISRKGSQYFVADLNSTNFTFVNSVKVMPGQEVQLNDRDILRFADEEFEFHAN